MPLMCGVISMWSVQHPWFLEKPALDEPSEIQFVLRANCQDYPAIFSCIEVLMTRSHF